MKHLLLFFSVCLCVACSQPSSPDTPTRGMLVHIVILSLKEDTSPTKKEEILKLLDSLKKIPETNGLFTATQAATNDPRARTNYDIILQMSFSNKTDLETYSKDSFHLEVREKIKNHLSGPPIVYDYYVQ